MWRNLAEERGGSSSSSSGNRAAPLPGPQLASLGLSAQESPLLGLLSAVSRPAVSFLQRWSPFPPGRPLKQDLVQTEREFLLLQQLDDLLPPQQLHSLPWFNLSELGIPDPKEDPPHTTPPGTAGTGLGVTNTAGTMIQTETVLNHVLLQPPRPETQTWSQSRSKSWSQSGSQPWLGLWSGSDDERLRNISLFSERRSSGGGAKTVLSPGLPHLPPLPPLLLHGPGPGSVCAPVPVPVPDLDHGYSSLEEEQLQAARAQLSREETAREEEPETAREEEPQVLEEEEEEPVLKCENKAIAFIMGCPCSDDSDDDDDDDEEAVDEDDGFDSVCSSEISDSDSDLDCDDDDDDDDEEEDEDLDSETERLWSSLCQTHDPYSPRNFTAKLCSAPRPIPRPGPGPGPEGVQPSPSSSVSSSCSSHSSFSSSSSSSWDEASEAETEETLKLLQTFSSSSDPYSPLNFQASIRTKPGPRRTKPGPRAEPGLEPGSEPKPEEEEEERVRKISESSQRNSRETSSKKQVRFLSEVSVFSVEWEERRGPWEEFARDRARFAKRCSEVESVLSPCLSQEHRRRVYLRISQPESIERSRERISQPESRERISQSESCYCGPAEGSSRSQTQQE